MVESLDEFLGQSAVLSASVRVTAQCNLRCAHCYVYQTPDEGVRGPNELDGARVLRLFGELRDLGCESLFLSGGEPFLRSDVLELVRGAASTGMATAISSNGTAISSHQVAAIASAGLDMMQISIDGPQPVHDQIRGGGTFDRARTTLAALAQAGCRNRTVACTVGPANAGYLPQMLDVAADLQATHLSVTLIIPGGRARQAAEVRLLASALQAFHRRLLREDLRIRLSKTSTVPIALVPSEIIERDGAERFLMCSFPHMLGIDANGSVAPCDGFLGQGDALLGRLSRSSLRDIWHSARAVAVRSIRPADLCGVCSVCRFLEVCAGGCRAAASAASGGDLTAPDPTCQAFWHAGVFPAESVARGRRYRAAISEEPAHGRARIL